MAKKSDEIQRQIVTQRELITQRLQALQQRVKGDVRQTGEDVKERVTAPFVSAWHGLDEQVQRHPVTTVAGAFAMGVALGVATDMGGGDGDGRGRGIGALGGTLAGLATPFVDILGAEVRPLFRDVVSGFTSTLKARG